MASSTSNLIPPIRPVSLFKRHKPPDSYYIQLAYLASKKYKYTKKRDMCGIITTEMAPVYDMYLSVINDCETLLALAYWDYGTVLNIKPDMKKGLLNVTLHFIDETLYI